MLHTERLVVNNKLEEAVKFLAQFNQVVMHKSPHLDEIVAYYLLKVYGMLKASVRFVDADITGTEADHDRNCVLPIGCGDNCRFNEHRKGIERLKGECATTLAAKFLGINELPEVKRLIAEVLKCDTEAGCMPTQLAELVKVANRSMPGNYLGVLTWVTTALKAIIHNEQYHFTALPGEKSLVDLLKAMDAEGKYFSEDSRIREHLFRISHDSLRRSDKCITELASILQAMHRLPYKAEDISTWLETPLLQITSDQLQFWQLVDLYKKQEIIPVRAMDNRGEYELKLMVIESDDLQAPRAARFTGADIVLCRTSKGNVMISVDTRIPDLNLSNVVRMIRWMDLPKKITNEPSWLDLGVPGAHDLHCLAHWYYFKKGEQIFNGSQTHSAPPTKIPTEALVEAIKYGLHPHYVKMWCNDRRIVMNPKRLAEAMQHRKQSSEKPAGDMGLKIDLQPKNRAATNVVAVA